MNYQINFHGVDVRMEGTIQDPLFCVRDILVKVLGYNDICENNFYRENKKDSDLVQKIGKKAFFTEDGLYVCLFRSNKTIACEFQRHISKLLKDIRLGNVQLQIVNDCAFAKVIQELSENTILGFIFDKVELLKTAEIHELMAASIDDKIQIDRALQQQKILQHEIQILHKKICQKQKCDDECNLQCKPQYDIISNEEN